MSTSSIKVYQCMHSPFFYCVWMKSQGRKSKKLYFLSHQSKYCYIYYNFVHIYETLGISTSQPHHSRQLIVRVHTMVALGSILSIIFESITQKTWQRLFFVLHFKVKNTLFPSSVPADNSLWTFEPITVWCSTLPICALIAVKMFGNGQQFSHNTNQNKGQKPCGHILNDTPFY